MVTWEDGSVGTDNNDSINADGGFMNHHDDIRMTPETNKAESLYGGSQTTLGDSSTGHDDSGDNIGRRETAQVTYLRCFTLLVLFLAAGLVSATVFLVTTNAQEDDFETKFDGVAGKVLETFEEIVSEKLAALSSFSVSTTAFARSQNASFPYVTMNDFQQRAGSIREVVDCLLVYTIYQVFEEERAEWENYTVANMEWYFNDLAYQEERNMNIGYYPFSPVIYRFDVTEDGIAPAYETAPGPHAAIWQSSPLFPSFPNFNVATYPPYGPAVTTAIKTGNMAIGGIQTAPPGNLSTTNLDTILYVILLSAKEGKNVTYNGDPMAYVALPIFDDFDTDRRKPVGTVSAIMNWATYFKGVVPPTSKHVTIVLENACDGAYTYEADNDNVVFLGQGDLHEQEYDHMEQVANLNALVGNANKERVYNTFELEELGCPYNIRVYPTTEMEEDSEKGIPFITTLAVAAVFVFTALVFWIYNLIVERRQRVVLSQAKQSTDLVSTFLPKEVQKRLLLEDDGDDDGRHISPISRLKAFLSEGEDTQNKPIADLFPHCTVLFSDIAGFTAWSSTREPAQVFVLLQTVYQAFDTLAKKHKVFKIETIGDTYVAVTGLPNEQPMHAILMARFAWDCMLKMNSLVKELERTLGPDTADLAMRMGLHSGPVTAGVLRGDRPRFQLFGDTVNTASRMESTGMQNKIQVSHTTAAEIEKLGKGRWLEKRKDVVIARGKAPMQTCWLVPLSKPTSLSSDFSKSDSTEISSIASKLDTICAVEKQNRLVDWCVEVLLDKLRQIQALRQGLFLAQTASDDSLVYKLEDGRTCMDEVQEVMKLPPYDPKAAAVLTCMNHNDAKIDPDVKDQLREFVSCLAQTYRSNSFHNWEHAMHVTMSCEKFLKRIISPNMDGDIRTLHEYTHGLTSDPLLLMAIILSSVIHDADHRGVSNMQLAKEEEEMASLYKNKSIAEQNSLDIAWDLFMEPNFASLRQAMFVNRSEMLRFRQILVQMVLATDIFDKELNDLRKSRWRKAFSDEGSTDNDLRATIVIEHIIQASDVSHTMQHWHIYRKWNERLFLEMTQAYLEGRMGKDPADFWYEGELGFFDNYIIPLAKKLKECNVFGVSSHECLNYATQNRLEWEQRGKQVVESLIQVAKEKFPLNDKMGIVNRNAADSGKKGKEITANKDAQEASPTGRRSASVKTYLGPQPQTNNEGRK